MDSSDIIFDDEYCMYGIPINGQTEPVCLEISDGLYAADELLRGDYKSRIADFLNSSKAWFPIAFDKITSDVGNSDGLRLMTIYVLFEQNQKNSLYGLLFNLNCDREHGRGMMINGENFKIEKYGEAWVAFQGLRNY
jgi:hypothetical protein